MIVFVQVTVGSSQAVLVAKNLPDIARDIRDVSLISGQDDPLEKGMAAHFSILV